MNRIFHIARETLRGLVRSRLVLSLFLLLLLVLVVLPYAVKGSGTVEETRRLAFTWSLGLCAIILSVSSLWTACSTLSSEVENRTWHSLAVTPTSAFFIWTGKWLGLVALNALLLLPVLLGVGLQARLQGIPPAELQPLERLSPTPASIHAEATRRFHDLAARGIPETPEKLTPDQWIDRIYKDFLSNALALSGGNHFAWEFSLPEPTSSSPKSASPYASLTLVSPFGSAAEINGKLSLFAPDGTLLAARPITPSDERELRLPLPTNAPGGSLRLLFENTSPPATPAALFHPAENAALFLPQSTCTGNLLRAGLVLLALLSTLSAIGTASGALFSRPVAIFVSTCLVLLGVLSHSNLSESEIGNEDDPVAAHHHHHHYAVRSQRFLDGIAFLTAPIAAASPLDRAGDSLLIPARSVRDSLLFNGLLLPLILGLLTSPKLRYRDDP